MRCHADAGSHSGAYAHSDACADTYTDAGSYPDPNARAYSHSDACSHSDGHLPAIRERPYLCNGRQGDQRRQLLSMHGGRMVFDGRRL